MWLSDAAVEHLRTVAELPDFSGSRYRLLRELARGGMGVVYEAEDLELERTVAVKVLATELAGGDFAERMRREARVIARLEHPGIIPLHDAGTLPDGRVFYAMKLVRGRRLDEVVAARMAEEDDTGAKVAELLRLFLRVCEAVAFAHANGVVHCDLKPANVMVGAFGEVLVMDWGVARGLAELPATRVIAGTPGFMSPEQQRGQSVDAATDIYALGATLRSLLASPEGGAPPRRLAAIATKATAEAKSDRYGHVGELAADVVRYLDGRALLAYRENVLERAGRWLTRNRALVTIVLAYLIMRAIVLLWVHR
jgi:serine/threonine protein kinase